MGGGGGEGPMGGDLPVGGVSGGCDPCGTEGTSATGERLGSLAFSAMRARRASRALLSSSPRRSASITVEPGGLDGVGGDGGGDVSLPAREAADVLGAGPRRPPTFVHPSSLGPSLLVGEVWVAAVARGAVAGGGTGAACPEETPGPVTSRSPNDCRSEISWFMLCWFMFCWLLPVGPGRVSLVTVA